MLLAVKEHVCSGKRIYAEGSGLAYLCQHVETAMGKRTPLVGALRAVARRSPVRVPPAPAEITLMGESWLGAEPAPRYVIPQYELAIRAGWLCYLPGASGRRRARFGGAAPGDWESHPSEFCRPTGIAAQLFTSLSGSACLGRE